MALIRKIRTGVFNWTSYKVFRTGKVVRRWRQERIKQEAQTKIRNVKVFIIIGDEEKSDF
jgi:hypothetical protein